MLELRWRIKPSAVILIVVVVVLVLRYGYDTLVDERHWLHAAYDRMLIEKQRRLDTVTLSWDAVDRYQKLEQGIQTRVTTLNNQIKTGGGKAHIQETRKELEQLISGLDLLKEKYPWLNAKEPYLSLMEIMKESGLRVTNARLLYNQRVYHYNVMCRLFPYVLFARLLGYKQEHYLQTEATGVRYR